MKFSTLILGALGVLPALSSTIAVSDVMQRSLAGYAKYAKRDSISTVLDDIEHATTCAACESLLVVLKVVASLGNKAFVDVIVAVCKDLKVEDADVCAGAIGLEGPILAHDLRQMTIGTKTSQLFCLTVFGLFQWPNIDTAGAPVLSAKPAASRPNTSGKSPLKVVHISDIHIDLSYETGASWNCTKNICCRPYTAADEPGNTDTPSGPYGNTHCDSPVTLEASMYAAIDRLVPDRDFSIFTGDVVEGAVWLVTDSEVTNDLSDAYSRMQSLGTVYPVTGNHDSCPVNSFPPADVSTTISSQFAYDTMSSGWQQWIGSSAASEVSSNFGSYSVVHPGGLKVISVNTNFWYKQNFWMYEKTIEADPSGMFAWLVAELQAAEAAGQRVWILGHMPMGASDAFRDASYYYDSIIQRYDATIAAIFYGHTHKDEFQIAYSDYKSQSASTATMMSYIAPALTPTSGNPTFRVYEVDPVTFGVLDYTVYYTNISSPTYQSAGPTWSTLYSAKELYGSALGVKDPAAELTPAFWHNVTALFESDDSMFQTYIGLKSRNYDLSTCSGTCKTNEICQLRAAQAQYNCAKVQPGVHFKRDIAHSPSTVSSTAGECDGSQAIPILGLIPGNIGINSLTKAIVSVLGNNFLNITVPTNYTMEGFMY